MPKGAAPLSHVPPFILFATALVFSTKPPPQTQQTRCCQATKVHLPSTVSAKPQDLCQGGDGRTQLGAGRGCNSSVLPGRRNQLWHLKFTFLTLATKVGRKQSRAGAHAPPDYSNSTPSWSLTLLTLAKFFWQTGQETSFHIFQPISPPSDLLAEISKAPKKWICLISNGKQVPKTPLAASPQQPIYAACHKEITGIYWVIQRLV